MGVVDGDEMVTCREEKMGCEGLGKKVWAARDGFYFLFLSLYIFLYFIFA